MNFLMKCSRLPVVAMLACAGVLKGAEFYLSPEGNDQNPGGLEAPFKTLGKAMKAVEEHQLGPGEEAHTVWVRGGCYPVSKTLEIGEGFRGSKGFPIRIRAFKEETPIFDAGTKIPLEEVSLLQDERILSRIAVSARGKVYALPISKPQHQKALSKSSTRLSLDGRMMSLARYPNVGFTHIAKIHDKGAIYAHGRTKGSPPKWSLENPIGGRFSLEEKDLTPWVAELKRGKKALVTGYLAYDWYRESHYLSGVRDGVIQLGSFSRYGILSKGKIPRRFFVSNLLCELDTPGEFFFDEKSSTLYLIPPEKLSSESSVNIWGGPGFLCFKGATYLSLEGVVVEGVGSGTAAVEVQSGNHLRMLGCTIRNCSRPAVVIKGGHDNGLISCDLYDVPSHLTLEGGEVKSLKSAGNFAINCHLTQIASTDYYGGIRVRGVGQVFRNNLVHNCPGQVMTFGGCDHRIANNEFFNVGFEEGDGGAIYSGASAWSWGNRLEHNFLHHLMCLPQAHPRGGIYPDDGDMGEVITGNVFYKAAHRAVLINGGAGHQVKGNLFLNGYIGIYNTETNAEKRYREIAKYDSGELKRGDKGDWIWRTEQVIGPEGWNSPRWSKRFPEFAKIMRQHKMRHFPIECDFSGNRFAGNWRDIEWRVGRGDTGVRPVDQVEMVSTSNNREIDMGVFRSPEVLDFRYQRSQRGLPVTRFADVGLRKDAYRKVIPVQARYRKMVKDHFSGQKSYDPMAVYDPKAVSQKIYFNSGRLLYGLGGMLH